jgi:hypothetical protein
MKRSTKNKKKSKSLLARTVESFKVSKAKDFDSSNYLNNELFTKTLANNFDKNQSLKIFSYNQKKLSDYEKSIKNHKMKSNFFSY